MDLVLPTCASRVLTAMGTVIEFEHTGTGSAIENEADEAAEWEYEQEKGGEVELEQFWIQKSFGRAANVKAGHIIVPVGLNNAYHEPLNYFTVYRPEGENTILPSTWHDTGIAFWGRSGKFRYELDVVAGLNAMLFNRDKWIHHGAGSPFEFKPANQMGAAARVDFYAMKGLRFGLSGYVGNSVHNTFPNDIQGDGKPYDDANGVWSAGNDGCCCLHLDGGAIVGVKLLQVPFAFAKGGVKHFLRSREGEDCSVPLVG